MKKTIIVLFIFPLSLMANDLKLVGKGLLEYSIFKIDIYEISYYKGKKSDLEELVLNYKIDVKKEHSEQGWREGLKGIINENPKYAKNIKWILSNTSDLKENDEFKIRRNKNEVTLFKNNNIIAQVTDEIVAKLIFYPWLGKEPIDEELKNNLLNSGEA